MDMFIAKVIDVKDPEQSGRVKIRIYGLHDDTSRVPDDMLPWARCVFPVTNPVRSGMAGPTTGLINDSTVLGHFADKEKQIPLITGTLGGVTDEESDFPKADRGEDFNDVLQKDLPSVGTNGLKFFLDKSIGSIDFLGQGIDQLMQEIGEGDIIGILSQASNILQDFDNLKNSIVGAGIDQLNGIIQGYVSDGTHALGGILSEVIDTTELGTVIGTIDSTAFETGEITDSINHLIGNIGTRTSKSPLTTVQDVIGRISGHRFVMGGVMSSIESSLNRLVAIG